MRAVVITVPGPPSVLKVLQVPDPLMMPGFVLARVQATAVNRADILQRLGKYPPPSGVREDIPGLEFSGVVEEADPGDKTFRPGDRIMGLLPGEGYAEKVALPVRLAVHAPEELDFIQCAAVPEAFLTALDALHRLKLKAGQTILIHAAASGVGTAAIQLAKLRGARVIGTTGSKEKLGRIRELGADHSVDYRSESFAEIALQLTGGRGVEAILDLVGGCHWAANLTCLAERGRLLLVGLVGGRHVQADLGLILRKRLTILGTLLRSRSVPEKATLTEAFRREVLPHLASGRLHPVVDCVFPLEEAAEAHRYIEENRNVGKVVLEVSGSQA